MDENNLADFNELNNLAHEILSSVKDDLGTARKDFDKSQERIQQLEAERDYLSGEVSKLTTSNQTLTTELSRLRDELSKLNDSYQTLTASLLKAQEESETLRSKIAQVQKLLAG